jgi:hypothetical protein
MSYIFYRSRFSIRSKGTENDHFFYFILDSENSEELIFVLKSLTLSFLILTLGLAFKTLKIIN